MNSPGDDATDGPDATGGELGPRYSVPALEKALDILEVLAAEPHGLPMALLATRVGRRITEIYRMVQCLHVRGYVERDATDQYGLSLMLFDLAHRHPPMRALLRRARPVMERLAAETMQSCHLAVLHGDAVLIAAQVDSPRAMQYSVRIGASFPLLQTSSGLVLSAFAGRERQAALFARLGSERPDQLLLQLDRIRRDGGDRRESMTVNGIINLSRPILDVDGHAVAALTIPFAIFRDEAPSEKRALAKLAAATSELSLNSREKAL